MGNACSSIQNPDTRNLCNVSIDQRSPKMPGFCTKLQLPGVPKREEYCDKMSTAGEWGDPQPDDLCFTNSCNLYQEMDFGCCEACCSDTGYGMNCKRLKFTGNPVTCCLNDYSCSNDPSNYNPLCFSDSGQQQTCSDGQNGQPNYRSIVSTDCQDVLFQYCTGTLSTDDPNSTEWLNRWTVNNGGEGSCAYALSRNIFQQGGSDKCFTPITPIPGICNIPPPFPIDSAGYFWAQQLMSAAFRKYAEQGFILGALPGSNGYNIWQDFIYNTTCCPYAGICQPGLNLACSTYTTQQVSQNPSIAQWCGCHLSTEEYQEYSVKYNIPPQCTPMCNRAGVIPIIGINAEPINCEQDICIIDDVSVNLVNAQIGGGINFNQVCGNCPNAQCSCIISDTTIDIANSTIGGNLIPVNDGCGNISCTQTNPGLTGPNVIPVECGTGGFNPYSIYDQEVDAAELKATNISIFWTIVAVGIGLLLIFLIILFINPTKYLPQGFTQTVYTKSNSLKPDNLTKTKTQIKSNSKVKFTTPDNLTNSILNRGY